LQLSFGESQHVAAKFWRAATNVEARHSEPQHVAAKFCEPKRAATCCS
jgi:hypothetical protein